MSLREFIQDVSLIDNHAHQITPVENDLSPETFAGYFTEGAGSHHARHTMNYRRGLSVVAEFLGDGSEADLVERRGDVEFDSYARELMNETDVSHILQDTGTPPGSDPKTFAQYTDADVRPILRIENEIEDLIEATDTFGAFEEAFTDRCTDALTGDHVGLKSIIAYRTGLNITTPARSEAAKAYYDVSENWTGRIEHPVLLNYTAHLATVIAGEHDAPIQFHSGFGDIDAHPQYVDPSYMWGFLKAHRDTDIVLLHASYPYTRTAGYIVSLLENVYLDLGMTIPFIQHGVEPMLRHALELAPASKLLYSSDGYGVPEWYVLAERLVRDNLATVLEDLVANGTIDEVYAEEVAAGILRENAERLYPL